MNVYKSIKESYNSDGTKHYDNFDVTNDGINTEKHYSYWAYISKHGIGPGTVPSDIEVSHVCELPNTMKTLFLSNRELTPEELKKYELQVFDSKSDPEVLKELFSKK